jgi:hypothetical protein
MKYMVDLLLELGFLRDFSSAKLTCPGAIGHLCWAIYSCRVIVPALIPTTAAINQAKYPA